MRRFLGILIVFGLLAGQGFSVAAAICQHHSAREHALALQSHDKRIAAVALTEESAASVTAKKGALTGTGASFAPVLADLLPAPSLLVRSSDRSPPSHSPTDARELVGISPNPLLRPPLA